MTSCRVTGPGCTVSLARPPGDVAAVALHLRLLRQHGGAALFYSAVRELPGSVVERNLGIAFGLVIRLIEVGYRTCGVWLRLRNARTSR